MRRVYAETVVGGVMAFLQKYKGGKEMEDDLWRILRIDSSYQTDVVLSEVQNRLNRFSGDLVGLRREPPEDLDLE